MFKQKEEIKENKSRTVANSVPLKKSNAVSGFNIVDNRTAGMVQPRLESGAVTQMAPKLDGKYLSEISVSDTF